MAAATGPEGVCGVPMNRSLALIAFACCMAHGARGLEAQVVRASATPLMPHSWSDASTKSSDRDRERDRLATSEAARSIALYGAAYLGTPGNMIDSSGVAKSDKSQLHFPAIHFVFSAAARLRPHSGEVRAGRALKRMNAHVQIEPLDKDTQLISERGAVEVLDIQPNTQNYVKAGRDTTSVSGAAVVAVSRTVVKDIIGMATGTRFGPVIARFSKIFHHPSAPTQVSYVSDQNEFGWTWYEHSDTTTLEGIHRAAVLLESSPRVQFLRIRIQVITDWGGHGAWRREFESIVDLGPATT